MTVLAVAVPSIQGVLQFGAVVVGVGFLVFVHELGHFLLAKMQGVRVERFAIGLGRKLVGVTWGETEYALCLIPFGGYVKMAGEYPDQERVGADYEFYSKPPGRRALIVVAGVVMNAIFGVLIFIGAFRLGVLLEAPEVDPMLGKPAWVAGLREGDVILEADGTKINSITDLAHVVMVSEGAVALKIRRGDEVFVEHVVPEEDKEYGVRTIGVEARAAMTVGACLPGKSPLLLAEDVSDWGALCRRLNDAGSGGPSPAGRLRELLSDRTGAAVRAAGENPGDAERAAVLRDLNFAMGRRDLYQEDHFAGVTLPSDVKRQLEEGIDGLDAAEILELNRRLIEVAFPGSVAEFPGKDRPGIRKGDTVLTAGGEELVSWSHFSRITRESPGSPLTLTLRRKGAEEKDVETITAVPMPIAGWSSGCTSRNDLYIGSVRKGTVAAAAGLEAGDRIISLNGDPTGGGGRFRDLVGASAGEKIVLGVDRNGTPMQFEMIPEMDPVENRALIGVMFRLDPVVGTVRAGSPAEKTGLQTGDTLVSLALQGSRAEEEIVTWNQFETRVNLSEGKTLTLSWSRNGKPYSGTLVPEYDPSGVFGRLGLRPNVKLRMTRLGLAESVSYGIRNSYAMGKRVIGTIYGLLSLKVSPKVVAGPVLLPVMGMWFVERGIGTFLYFLGMIGINFAIVNLLPLPVVDGGVLMLIGIEKVRGKPLSLKSQTIIQQIGVAILVAIFLLITIQDVGRLSSLLGG